MSSGNNSSLEPQFLTPGFGDTPKSSENETSPFHSTRIGAAITEGAISKFKDMFFSWKTERGKNLRKWGQFCDRSKFLLPRPTQVLQRLKTNLSYFQTNYLIVFLVLTVYCVLTNPFFLFAVFSFLALYVYLFYWRSQPLKVGSHIVSDKEKTILVGTVTVIFFYIASVGSTIFWLLGVSITIVFIHALLYNPTNESEDYIDFNSSFVEEPNSV
jgi:hypothetical protein